VHDVTGDQDTTGRGLSLGGLPHTRSFVQVLGSRRSAPVGPAGAGGEDEPGPHRAEATRNREKPHGPAAATPAMTVSTIWVVSLPGVALVQLFRAELPRPLGLSLRNVSSAATRRVGFW